MLDYIPSVLTLQGGKHRLDHTYIWQQHRIFESHTTCDISSPCLVYPTPSKSVSPPQRVGKKKSGKFDWERVRGDGRQFILSWWLCFRFVVVSAIFSSHPGSCQALQLYPPNPQHKTVWRQTGILPHYNHLLPWPAPPSSPILPFSSPSPFLSPFLLLPHLFYFLAGVSKQLKHLQGVTLRPHAPPNVASAGGKRQRWKGERFIRLFMVRVRLRKSQGCPLTLARAKPDKPSFPSARLSYPTHTFLSLSSSFPSLNCSA